MNILRLLALVAVLTTACTVSAAPFVAPYQPDDDTLLLYHFNEPAGWISDAAAVPDSNLFVIDSANDVNLQTSDLSVPGVSPFATDGPIGLGTAAMPGSSGSVVNQRLYRQTINAAIFDVNNFTAEMWIKPDDVANISPYAAFCQILDGQVGGTINSLFLWSMNATSDKMRLLYKGTDNGIKIIESPAVTFAPDTWYHVAMSVENQGAGAADSRLQFYFTPETNTTGAAVPLGGPIAIADLKPFASNNTGFFELGGARGSTPLALDGGMDEFRWSNTVRSEFNMPMEWPRVRPYQADSDTALLFHFEEPSQSQSTAASDAFIVDASASALNMRTNFSATGSPDLDYSPFKAVAGPVGLGMAATAGVEPTQWMLRRDVDVGGFNTEDFTIEMWVRNPDTDTPYSSFYQMGDYWRLGSTSHATMFFGLNATGDRFRFFYKDATDTYRAFESNATISFSEDEWYHIALVFDGDDQNALSFYCTPESNLSGEAIQIGTSIAVPDLMPFLSTTDGYFEVGAARGATANFVTGGDIDEFRYSNVARESFNLKVIPEPGVLALLFGAGLVFLRRQR